MSFRPVPDFEQELRAQFQFARRHLDVSNEQAEEGRERYELEQLIARGGTAEVYRAHDRFLERPVAVKVLFSELSVDPNFVERFRREAKAAAKLSHPNIVPVYDWDERNGMYFIVMELVEGKSLSDLLTLSAPIDPVAATGYIAESAGALAYAHRRGVIHRDVKPGNLLLSSENRIRVTDFGLARAVNRDQRLTQSGIVMGTAKYLSPEQAQGQWVDARSDIYSLGVVAFELLAGRPPFLGESPVAVAAQHARDAPPDLSALNPSIPRPLEAVVMTAMAKRPDDRYRTAEDFRSDLLGALDGSAACTPPLSATRPMSALESTEVISPPGGTRALPAATGPPAGTQTRNAGRARRLGLLLVPLLLTLGVIGYLVARSQGLWSTGSSVAVPVVAGDTRAQAAKALIAAGLRVGTTQEAFSDSVPLHRVIGTHPPARSLVQSGSVVNLVVSSGSGIASPTGTQATGSTEPATSPTDTSQTLTSPSASSPPPSNTSPTEQPTTPTVCPPTSGSSSSTSTTGAPNSSSPVNDTPSSGTSLSPEGSGGTNLPTCPTSPAPTGPS